MGLRNAFEELALESTLRKILAAVQYAKTTTDQLRVVVDSGTTNANIYAGNTSAAIVTTPVAMYNTVSWNLQDARETAREASEQHFVLTRNRWTIS